MSVLKLLKEGDAILLDKGFQYGMALFETIYVTSDGKGLFLDQHLTRLTKSASLMGLTCKIKREELETLIKAHNLSNVALKIMLSEENAFAMVRDNPYVEQDYEIGFKLGFAKTYRDMKNPLWSLKSANYYTNIMEKKQGKQQGYDEVLFVNQSGFICEGTMSNVFYVIDHKIFTPSEEQGLLNGIVRQWVVDQFDVKETSVTPEELCLNADEIFITNSLMGIMPVNSIEYQEKSMAISKKIHARYEQGLDVR